MKRRPILGLLWLLLGAGSFSAAGGEGPLLVRFPAAGDRESAFVSGGIHLQDASGRGYVLAKAGRTQMDSMGRPYEILDAEAGGARYLLARIRDDRVRAEVAARHRVMLDDGRRLLIRVESAGEAEALSARGAEIAWVFRHSTEPVVRNFRRSGGAGKQEVERSPLIQDMLESITTNRLWTAMRELTGPVPAVADGSYGNIGTRHTASGQPLSRALAYAGEYFKALGYETVETAWSLAGYSSRNVVATLPGTTSPEKIVVICAHLDDMPSGTTAPGADDNASGSVAVLTAADRFRGYRFEKTVRFILFTGEEQGLLGSMFYAAQAALAGEEIVAVLNCDMIAWDSDSDGRLRIHTREASDSDHGEDLAIAVTFSNAVAAYAISNLNVVITSDGEYASDHGSFWEFGYPAVLAIEDDWDDFNPYYHSTLDTLDRLNWPYFQQFVRAGVATVAHLAGLVGDDSSDAVRMIAGPFVTNCPVGYGTFVFGHCSDASEADDRRDAALVDAPAQYWTNRVGLTSRPGATNLWRDERPSGSETIVSVDLVALHSGTPLAISNRLRFDFPGGGDPDGVYLARVSVPGAHLDSGEDFCCVTNLRELVAAGGFLDLPGTWNVPNGTVYGTCEVRRLRVEREPRLEWAGGGIGERVLLVEGQPGIATVDEVESTDAFATWAGEALITNRAAVDSVSFDSGQQPLSLGLQEIPEGAASRYYRLRRIWLSP